MQNAGANIGQFNFRSGRGSFALGAGQATAIAGAGMCVDMTAGGCVVRTPPKPPVAQPSVQAWDLAVGADGYVYIYLPCQSFARLSCCEITARGIGSQGANIAYGEYETDGFSRTDVAGCGWERTPWQVSSGDVATLYAVPYARADGGITTSGSGAVSVAKDAIGCFIVRDSDVRYAEDMLSSAASEDDTTVHDDFFRYEYLFQTVSVGTVTVLSDGDGESERVSARIRQNHRGLLSVNFEGRSSATAGGGVGEAPWLRYVVPFQVFMAADILSQKK